MRLYLALYNSAQTLGWASILALIVANQTAAVYSVPAISLLLRVFQSLMLMDVVHSLLRISPSPIATTLMQILSRLLVVYGVLELQPKVLCM